MDYSILAETYEKLEKITGKIEKTNITFIMFNHFGHILVWGAGR